MKMTQTPKNLKIKNGKFLFLEIESPKLRKKLNENAYWTNIGNDSYETKNLGAALKFRKFADDRLEKIFQKTLQCHYEISEQALAWLDELPGLDPHQREGIKFILERKRSYLAHAPGAGKTCEAIIASYLAADLGPVLFIVPPSLVENWKAEILKFTEWTDVFPTIGVVKGSDERDKVAWRADFIIVPDSMLTKDWVYTKLLSLRFSFIAVDEASRFKDPFAKRSLAFYGGKHGAHRYPGLFRMARHVVFLDGSPMPNRPMELWAPAFALHPESIDCLELDDFGYRYCGARPNERGVWEYLHSSREDELRGKLQADFMHVVAESSLRHPERRRSIAYIEDLRSPEHRKWERTSLPKEITSEDNSQGELARFRKELGIRKVPAIAKHVAMRLERGESILLFVWHREVAQKLACIFLNHHASLIIGGVAQDVRQKIIEGFQKGITKLLIMNIAAAGRGLNLQRADRVIFGEFSWTDETNKQCEKRASRKGSEKEFVRCEYLVSKNSMDEVVLRSVFTKEARVRKVIGS